MLRPIIVPLTVDIGSDLTGCMIFRDHQIHIITESHTFYVTAYRCHIMNGELVTYGSPVYVDKYSLRDKYILRDGCFSEVDHE